MTSPRFEWAIAGWMAMSLLGFISPAKAAIATAAVSPSTASPAIAQAAEFEYDNVVFWAEQCLLLHTAEDYEAAIASCEQAISLRPNADNLELWSARGDALFQTGHYAEALVSYRQVTAIMPEHSPALTEQCAALVQLGQWEAALATCEAAIAADSEWGENSPVSAWYYRGVALQGLGYEQRAFEAFFKAQVFDPTDPRPAAEICVLAEALQQLEGCSIAKAAAAYDQALAADPYNALLWYRQGLVLEQLGQYNLALVSYQRTVAARPDHSLALAHQCAVLNELADFEAAIAACEAAFAGSGKWDELGAAYGWSQTSAAQIGLGDYESALASADRAISLNRHYLGGWNNRAVSLWHLGQFEDALRAITVSHDQPVPEPFIFDRRREVLMAFNRGLILQELDRHREAIAAYSRAIALQQIGQDYLGDDGTLVSAAFMADVWLNLALAQLATGEIPQSTRSAREAIAQNPTGAETWSTLALIRLSADDVEGAWYAYGEAAQRQPDSLEVLTGQGFTLQQADCPQAALQVFSAILNLDPSNLVAQQQYRQLLQVQQALLRSLADPNNESATVTNDCRIQLPGVTN
ncbi:MAG: tetratricopeptide repeat protein [Cyanobacteria bacterium P01_H01_bin.162]